MEMIAQKFQSFDETERLGYRSWASVAPTERFVAAHQVSVERYRADSCLFDGLNLKELLFALTRNTLDVTSSADMQSSYMAGHA